MADACRSVGPVWRHGREWRDDLVQCRRARGGWHWARHVHWDGDWGRPHRPDVPGSHSTFPGGEAVVAYWLLQSILQSEVRYQRRLCSSLPFSWRSLSSESGSCFSSALKSCYSSGLRTEAEVFGNGEEPPFWPSKNEGRDRALRQETQCKTKTVCTTSVLLLPPRVQRGKEFSRCQHVQSLRTGAGALSNKGPKSLCEHMWCSKVHHRMVLGTARVRCWQHVVLALNLPCLRVGGPRLPKVILPDGSKEE